MKYVDNSFEEVYKEDNIVEELKTLKYEEFDKVVGSYDFQSFIKKHQD